MGRERIETSERAPPTHQRAVSLGLWAGSGRPAGLLEQGWKWARRNPIVTVSLVAAVLAAVVVTVSSVLIVQLEIRRRQESVKAANKIVQLEIRRRQSSVHAAIRIALQRGAAMEALRIFDEETPGLVITPEMWLDRARALISIGGQGEALKALRTIDRDKLPDDLKPTHDLLLGFELVGLDDVKSDALLNEALKGQLAAADCAFALGLLADSTLEARSQFENALRLDPAHSEARMMLVITLFMLGEMEQVVQNAMVVWVARRDSPETFVYLVLAYLFLDDEAKALELLEELEKHFGKERVDDWRAFARFQKLIMRTQQINMDLLLNPDFRQGCSRPSRWWAPGKGLVRMLPKAVRNGSLLMLSAMLGEVPTIAQYLFMHMLGGLKLPPNPFQDLRPGWQATARDSGPPSQSIDVLILRAGCAP